MGVSACRKYHFVKSFVGRLPPLVGVGGVGGVGRVRVVGGVGSVGAVERLGSSWRSKGILNS